MMNVPKGIRSSPSSYSHSENRLLSLEENHFSPPFPSLLVIDDDAINQKILQHWLEKLNCQVMIATSGVEGIHQFHNDFDMILLDIHLPDMSGLEVCQRLREKSDSPLLPILAITAHYEERIKQECLSVGMNGVLTKPLLMQTMMTVLNTWLPQKE